MSFFSDTRILSAILIGMLGMTFLAHASSRSWPYVKWLAGAALVFGVSQGALVSMDALGWVSASVVGPIGSVMGLATMAAVMAGLQACFSPGGMPPMRVFIGLLVGAPLLVVAMSTLLHGWNFAGPATIALIFSAASVWLVSLWLRDGWGGQLVLAVLFLAYPLLFLVAMLAGLSLLQLRQLTPLPVSIAFVFVMTLIMQRESKIVVRELRERVKAEIALQQLTDSLEEIVRSRTRQLEEIIQGLRSFAGMVSHDLRGPLRNTAGLADLALDEYRAGHAEGTEQALQRIRREAQRASSMVNDLLTLAKVDEEAPSPEAVDMQALLRDCLQSLSVQFPQASDVVQASPLPVVQADAGLMRHVLMNLLGNALKFGGERRDLRIALEAREDGGFWRFSVADNGPGFDPAKSHELFKPFSRLDERQAGGTGLGLTVVKRAVERHGGSVGASSEPGRGAAFWWTVPAAPQG
ncbi:sensor histidine kinase [Hydrogenophaga palleronii]|uniref:sensor histidine kinase n=1 Tax=Hydrogenophaga palleronii TaxID=65655 RepID=UPI0008246C1A|nr:HAMP domain-containing sensor histidine kinase [Hydrogenophaga palleronii]